MSFEVRHGAVCVNAVLYNRMSFDVRSCSVCVMRRIYPCGHERKTIFAMRIHAALYHMWLSVRALHAHGACRLSSTHTHQRHAIPPPLATTNESAASLHLQPHAMCGQPLRMPVYHAHLNMCSETLCPRRATCNAGHETCIAIQCAS